MGRPRLSIEEHVMRGTYRPDRHGPLPPGLDVPADVAERLRAERTSQSRDWRKKHPYRSRAFNRKSYAKRREREDEMNLFRKAPDATKGRIIDAGAKIHPDVAGNLAWCMKHIAGLESTVIDLKAEVSRLKEAAK